MRRCRAFGFAMLMSFSYSAFPDNGCQHPLDKDLPPCMSLTNFALKEIYDELMNVIQTPLLDEHEKSELRKDELRWIKSRDQQCELVSSAKFHSIEEWMHSIEADKTKARCVVEITNKRITELEMVKREREEKLKQVGGGADTVEVATIPEEGQDVLAFIPRGYAIFEKIVKDFNGDGLSDVAVILRATMPHEYSPRPFVILQRKSIGGYSLWARNDQVAPNGLAGGVSNPYGSDALKTKGSSVLIEETGGSSTGGHGVGLEFGLQNDAWYLVSRSEWSQSANDEFGICSDSEAPKLSMPWHCWKHEVHTNFVTGLVTESWFAHNDDNNQDRTKKIHRRAKVEALILLNELQDNDLEP